MKKISSRAFTLVELIVVITILAILGTIGFVSLQSYSLLARDSKRIADAKMFAKALNIYETRNNELPYPDDMTTITGSGVVFSYQGTLSGSVVTELGQGAVPLDPLLETPYIYAINSGRTNFQILFYTEKKSALLELGKNSVVAQAGYENMFPKTFGTSVGIILNTDNSPLTGTGLDLSATSQSYKYIMNSSVIEGNGTSLVASNPKASCQRLQESGEASVNGEYEVYPDGVNALQVYCDVESLGGGWTRLIYEDYESSASDWTYNNITTCGSFGKILGGYNVLPQYAVNAKTFTLPEFQHSEILVRFDYVKIDSWDPGENPVVRVNGVDQGLVASNIFPAYGDQEFICGSSSTDYRFVEYSFPVEVQQTSSSSSVLVEISSTLNQKSYDESFGHDNLEILVR